MEQALKLISTRRGSFYVAGIAALLSAVALLVYLNGYRNKLASGTTPVTVLIARQTIPKGTPGSVIAAKGLFTATTIRESQLREGALSDPASLRGKATTDEIYEGSQLTASEFSASADTLAASLTDKERLLTVPLDSAHGMIGQIEAGNRVDVYVVENVVQRGGASAGQTRPLARRIMQNIQVIAVGDSSGYQGSSKATNVSLRLTDKQAADLAFAADTGKVWLSLRPSASAKSSPPDLVSLETLMLGVPPVVVMRDLGGRR
jgi:Flp pilus assembly protein CpaB